MLGKRPCNALTHKGLPCRASALPDGEYCLFHDPASQSEVTEGRRLGGLRRKREVITRGAYDLESLTTVQDIRRLLEIGMVDLLGLDNSIARVRALTQLALAAAKLLEVGELETRVMALEAAVQQRQLTGPSAFDQEAALEAEFQLIGEGDS